MNHKLNKKKVAFVIIIAVLIISLGVFLFNNVNQSTKKETPKKVQEKTVQKEEKKKEEAEQQKEADVIKAIVEDAKMDIHEKMIKAQAQQMVEDFAQRIQSQGLSFEQYMQFTGSTPEMLLEQVTPQAEERIKARLVLEAVVKAENIEVSDEEFEKELEEMAKQYNMELDQIKQFTTDADKETIKKDIAVQKAAKLVVDAAK